MTAPPLTELDFMHQVTELAVLRGWEWFHVRAGRTLDSWRTPGSGTMAKGFPDLLCCRGSKILFIELKAEGGKLSEHQTRELDVLGQAAECWVFRPSDWPEIERVLR